MKSRWDLMRMTNIKIEKMLNIGSEITRKAAQIRQAVYDGQDAAHLCFELGALQIAHRQLAKDIEEEEASIRDLYQEPVLAVA